MFHMLTGTDNHNTATVRTGVNGTWSVVIAWVVAKVFGWEIDLNDPVIIAVIGVLITLWYRITTILAEIWPPLGYLFFGVNKEPSYNGE